MRATSELARNLAISAVVLSCLVGAAAERESAWKDIDGKPLPALDEAAATVMFFVTTDCPISNQYAPEMNRICDDYEGRGVQCVLAYVDPTLTPEQVRSHLTHYGHRRPAFVDARHEWVRRAGATITPEAALFAPDGRVVYRGRINNFYARLGVPRRQVTVHDLRQALDEFLAGQAVSTAETQAVGCFIPKLEWVQSAK